MADGRKQPAEGDAASPLDSMIADASSLWKFADQSAHALPIQMQLLLDGLRLSCLDQLRRTAECLVSTSHRRHRLIAGIARAESTAEQAELGALSIELDDLTATILKIQVQLNQKAE